MFLYCRGDYLFGTVPNKLIFGIKHINCKQAALFFEKYFKKSLVYPKIIAKESIQMA